MKTFHMLVFALLLTLPIAVFAAKNKKEITFDKTTTIGATELQPGTYTVAWTGAGPEVQVDFSQNRKNVFSTPAKLVNAPGPYDSAVHTRNEGNDSAVLEEIDFKNLQLIFPQTEQPSGK